MELTDQELIEDPECLGLVTRDYEVPVEKPKRKNGASVYTFKFPPQEGKVRPGDTPLNTETNETVGKVDDVDYEMSTIRLKTTKSLPDKLSLIPGKPIRHDALIGALRRFINSCISGDNRYACLIDVLKKRDPRLTSKLLPFDEDSSSPTFPQHLVSLLMSLKNSYLVIQGPPGTGKTTTASKVIVSLLRSGKRIGISSNSHKAINNLLEKTEKIALEEGFAFTGVKCASDEDDAFNGRCITNVSSAGKALETNAQLFAGTAWLFSDERFDSSLDFLFIDEAGQVSLAKAISTGTAAQNLILLGDPMQLPQPSKGIHPEGIGASVLEYIQGEHATIPPEKGIFLNTTHRLHSSICNFISKYVYEGRLKSLPQNDKRVVLGASESAGIHYLPVQHYGNSNYSEEEAKVIEELYYSLLSAKYQNLERIEDIDEQRILVVAPYNLQVNLLKRHLPPLARVGTIDKFQGQEAPIVIVSMATSSEEEIPRSMDFLFSQNRLNVALSRATSLAYVVMCPDLLRVRCNTVEQMRLVNFLCAVAAQFVPPL